MIRLGINGFGRIGRQVLKAVLIRYPEFLQVVAVNDLFDVETNAHLFKYDSNYGRFPGEVKVHSGGLMVNGQPIQNFAVRDPAAIPWKEVGVDIVVESTGLFVTGPKAAAHLEAGARKVYFASASPPVRFPNVYGIDMPNQRELVATGRTEAEIARAKAAGVVAVKLYPAGATTHSDAGLPSISASG